MADWRIEHVWIHVARKRSNSYVLSHPILRSVEWPIHIVRSFGTVRGIQPVCVRAQQPSEREGSDWPSHILRRWWGWGWGWRRWRGPSRVLPRPDPELRRLVGVDILLTLYLRPRHQACRLRRPRGPNNADSIPKSSRLRVCQRGSRGRCLCCVNCSCRCHWRTGAYWMRDSANLFGSRDVRLLSVVMRLRPAFVKKGDSV